MVGILENRRVKMRMILDIGCGNRKYTEEGATTIGLDEQKTATTDLVFDLDNSQELPFEDNYFDLIYSHHAFEHLYDISKVMMKLTRVLKPTGKMRIIVPHFTSVEAFTDLTHRHFFSSKSLDYFDETTVYGNNYNYYAKAKLRIIKKKIGFRWLPYQILIEPFANKFKGFYESKLAWIFPAAYLEFEIMKEKESEIPYDPEVGAEFEDYSWLK